jgi:ClpP class serine protease
VLNKNQTGKHKDLTATSGQKYAHFIEFLTKNRHLMDIHINYDNNEIVNSTNTKFLGLIIENMLSLNGHVDWLMSKLGSECYAIRAIKPYMAQGTIRI